MIHDLFRIKEQYGHFYIQKKFIEKECISNDFIHLLNFLFNIPDLKFKEKEVYYTIDCFGNKASLYSKAVSFKTFDKANEYINKLNPIYHKIQTL